MTLKQTKLIIKEEGNSVLYIDGVMHGIFTIEETPIVKNVLNKLYTRDADLSVLDIEE